MLLALLLILRLQLMLLLLLLLLLPILLLLRLGRHYANKSFALVVERPLLAASIKLPLS